MRDPEANPFPVTDAPRRAIWEMLVPRDIDAFLAADWGFVTDDFVETNFTGLDARFKGSPDDWRLSFPTLAAYRAAGPVAVAGFRQVLEAMMDPDLRRFYSSMKDGSA